MCLGRTQREVTGGNDQGTVGEPAAPLRIDTHHERRGMMPAGQLPERLQAHARRTGIKDAICHAGRLAGEETPDAGHGVSIDGVGRNCIDGLGALRRLHLFP